MTEVDFHFNADDKWGYTCRLLRKAVAKGARVTVIGDGATLRRLDLELWTFSEIDFVAHCAADDDALMVAASPVVFCALLEESPDRQVLLNLGSEVPVGFERFERLIEVVGTDDADRAQARVRWKHYLGRGYAISRHDITPREAH